MNNFDTMKMLIVLVVPLFLLCGCGVKEGAEFYALQKQNDKLTGSVSNLQVQVEQLVGENQSLQKMAATNAVAISLLIEDQRQSQKNQQTLQEQLLKLEKPSQTATTH
jgi:hypothetical protein